MLSKTKVRFHERMLRIAAEFAEMSDVPRHKFGSILVQNKTIVSSGHNQRKTHPKQFLLNKRREEGKQKRSWVHSEVACLSKLRKTTKDATLYISRLGPEGQPLYARPCAACMAEIVRSKVQTIIYTTELGYAIEHIAYEY